MNLSVMSRTGVAVLACAACATQSATPGENQMSPATPLAVTQEEVTLKTPTGEIFGTLELPAARTPVPVALIIAGSGPTDRNGNSPALPGSNNSLKMLADGLAARGIASLRYDKRGIAASRAAMTSESDIRFNHLLAEQLKAQLPPDIMAQTERILAALSVGTIPDSTPPMLAALFRPSVMPYLISWFKYDPAVEVGKLSIPVLIIQGTTDIQTSMTDANALAAGDPSARFLQIEGMNHILKEVSGDRMAQIPKYSDPSLPVVPKLLDEIVTFIKSVPGKS